LNLDSTIKAKMAVASKSYASPMKPAKALSRVFFYLALASVLAAECGTKIFAVEPATNSPLASDLLLLDSLGRVVKVPTNEVPSELQPPSNVGLEGQIPNPIGGASVPPEILQRLRANTNGFQFFPATPPLLMPYLAGQDEYGNTAIRPGALFNFVLLEEPVQDGKYFLSDYGFRYSLQQTITTVSMSGVKSGDSDLDYYTLNLKAKWNIYNAPDSGTAGWISSQIESKDGLNQVSDTQSAKSNLGTLTDPTGIWSSVNGFRIPELAWQQSLRHGEVVVVAGMVGQNNYIDRNAYADNGRGEFINSALINSQVLPLAQYNFGLNLQWQPLDEWYAMAGGSVGATPAGKAPWSGYNTQNWSLPIELGYAPKDFLDLGPGVYRVQPFLAGASDTTGGGLCFNLQQQLGADSPFGWFGRFGFGDSKVTSGAAMQAGTGFVVQGPFKHLLLQRTSNDFLGIGFIWSEPAYTTKTVYHENEYGMETVYALQLTPTIKIQPDLQLIWNPAFNEEHDLAMVFQLQVVLAW
jgi:porin